MVDALPIRARRACPPCGWLPALVLLGWMGVAAAQSPGSAAAARSGGAVDLAAAQSAAAAAAHAYEAGKFAEAATGFQSAIAAGLDHATLHYNLGNAYFKQGQVGRSIASYLRALRRDPRDRAARANLERARTLTRDEAFEPLTLPVFLRPVAWLYARLSLNEWTVLALCCLGLLAAAGICAQWGWLTASLRQVAAWAAIAGVVACGGMAAVHYRSEVALSTGVVVVPEVEVRSGPGSEYNLAFKIHEGLQLFISERRGEWVQIDLGGKLVGWVPADRIEGV